MIKQLNNEKHSSVNERSMYLNKWQRGKKIKSRLPDIDPKLAGIICGFVMGEGSFFIAYSNSKTIKVGIQIAPRFGIKLKKSDFKILELIRDTLGCGKIYTFKDAADFRVTKLDDLVELIIPFFELNPLLNIKQLDFVYFKIICYKLVHGEGRKQDGVRRLMNVKKRMEQIRK